MKTILFSIAAVIAVSSVAFAQQRPPAGAPSGARMGQGGPGQGGPGQGGPGGPGMGGGRQGGGGRRGNPMMRAMDELKLTDAQKAKAKTIMDNARKEREALDKKTRTAIEGILTADQKKKLATIMSQQRPGGQGGPGMGGPGQGAPGGAPGARTGR